MTRCKNKTACIYIMYLSVLHIFDFREAAIFYVKAAEFSIESYLPTKRYDPFSESLYCSSKLVRSYMWFCKIEYLLWSTELHKSFKYPAYTTVFYSGGKLSVGKSSCTSLTELYIALRIEPAATLEFLHFLATRIHIATSFKNYGLCSCH